MTSCGGGDDNSGGVDDGDGDNGGIDDGKDATVKCWFEPPWKHTRTESLTLDYLIGIVKIE